MTPQEYLQDKGLLDKDKTQFIIKYEDGREVDLCQLLKEYAIVVSINNDQIRDANESNYQ